MHVVFLTYQRHSLNRSMFSLWRCCFDLLQYILQSRTMAGQALLFLLVLVHNIYADVANLTFLHIFPKSKSKECNSLSITLADWTEYGHFISKTRSWLLTGILLSITVPSLGAPMYGYSGSKVMRWGHDAFTSENLSHHLHVIMSGPLLMVNIHCTVGGKDEYLWLSCNLLDICVGKVTIT